VARWFRLWLVCSSRPFGSSARLAVAVLRCRAPFPPPAHRTGRADLPHPALGMEKGEMEKGDIPPSQYFDTVAQFVPAPPAFTCLTARCASRRLSKAARSTACPTTSIIPQPTSPAKPLPNLPQRTTNHGPWTTHDPTAKSPAPSLDKYLTLWYNTHPEPAASECSPPLSALGRRDGCLTIQYPLCRLAAQRCQPTTRIPPPRSRNASFGTRNGTVRDVERTWFGTGKDPFA
jgi:hypothetical protein